MTFLAQGCDARELAGKLKLARLAVRQRTQQLRAPLKAFFGGALMADVCMLPQWFNDFGVVKEHLACRSERSWQTH